MQKVISKWELESVKGIKEVCDCGIDLIVFREFNKETIKKIDDLSKKFMPYRFETKTIGAYCEKCNNSYLVKIHYEASSKIDYETIDYIYKRNYFEIKDYIKSLEERYTNDKSHNIHLEEYFIKILRTFEDEESKTRVISYKNTINEHNYINNQSICYNCDNRYLTRNNLVECMKHKQIYKVTDTCDNFRSLYDYNFDEEGEE